jgi:nucleoid-associated protein YgaU
MGYPYEKEIFVTGQPGTSNGRFLRLESDQEAARALKAFRRARAQSRIRRQNALWTAGALTMLMALGTGALVSQLRSAPGDDQAFRASVVVTPGDTLWGLAQKYGNPNDYLPDRVEEIADANGISSSAALTPGQHLSVPVSNPAMIARMKEHQLFQLTARND